MGSLKGRIQKLEAAQAPRRPTFLACLDYARQVSEICDEEFTEADITAFAEGLYADGKPLLTHEEWLVEIEREEKETNCPNT